MTRRRVFSPEPSWAKLARYLELQCLCRVSDVVVRFDGNLLYDVEFARDATGRITRKIETIQSVTDTYSYTYDGSGRLFQVRQNGVLLASYSYDANGDRLSDGSDTAIYDAQDRQLTNGSATYTYTANGELLTKTAGGQTTSYEYDVQGNLVGVTLPDGTEESNT